MSSSTSKPELVLRIITLDFYMSHPVPGLDPMYSDFRGSSIVQVPVLRIFGSTKTGEKMCLHVHGVFPYLYVPLDEETSTNTGYLYQMAGSIDKLVNISLGQASSSIQHIYKIAAVSGMPFYGYHPSQHQFLKIYTYNPILLRKITNLLYKEPIMDRLYQPHEAHIPFTLQFMIDHNLHGMSFIKLSQVRYRDGSGLEKQTHCELEADAHLEHILNRLEVTAELTVNPGIAALWEDERQRRRNKNQASQIGPCLSLERNDVTPTDSHLLFKQALLDRLAVLSDEREVNRDRDRDGSMVYPPETPSSGGDLLNASFLDMSLMCSQDRTSSLEDTTLDEDGKKLLEVLENLADECESAHHDEEESITSQLVQEGADEEEQEQDMSVSLDFSDETLVLVPVPQMDGANDSDQDSGKVPTKRKTKKLRGKDMPNLDELDSFTNIKLRLRNNNKREEITIKQEPKPPVVALKDTEMKDNVTEKAKRVVTVKKRMIRKKPLNKYGAMWRSKCEKIIRLIRMGVKPKFRVLQNKQPHSYVPKHERGAGADKKEAVASVSSNGVLASELNRYSFNLSRLTRNGLPYLLVVNLKYELESQMFDYDIAVECDQRGKVDPWFSRDLEEKLAENRTAELASLVKRHNECVRKIAENVKSLSDQINPQEMRVMGRRAEVLNELMIPEK